MQRKNPDIAMNAAYAYVWIFSSAPNSPLKKFHLRRPLWVDPVRLDFFRFLANFAEGHFVNGLSQVDFFNSL